MFGNTIEKSKHKQSPDAVPLVLVDISLRIQFPDSLENFGSITHDDNVRFELYPTSRNLRLLQYPLIDLEGSYIFFDIPIRSISLGQAHDSIKKEPSKIQISIESAVKPHVMALAVKSVDESIHLANLRSWCTIPFRNLPANSVLQITSKDPNNKCLKLENFVQTLKECSLKLLSPTSGGKFDNAKIPLRAANAKPSNFKSEVREYKHRETLHEMPENSAATTPAEKAWLSLERSTHDNSDHENSGRQYHRGARINSDRHDGYKHGAQGRNREYGGRRRSSNQTKFISYPENDMFIQSTKNNTELESDGVPHAQSVQKWQDLTQSSNQLRSVQLGSIDPSSVSIDEWYEEVQDCWREKAEQTRYKPSALLAAVQQRRTDSSKTENSDVASHVDPAVLSASIATPGQPLPKASIQKDVLESDKPRLCKPHNVGSMASLTDSFVDLQLLQANQASGGRGKLERGGALFRPTDPDSWKQFIPWAHNSPKSSGGDSHGTK